MAEQNYPMMAEPTTAEPGPDIPALRHEEVEKILSSDEEKAGALNQEYEQLSEEEFDSITEEVEKILSGQMSDEEKAVALKQELEQISDEEFGSITKLSIEQLSNECMVACVENEVEKIFKKILVECANMVASHLANMKLFSYEKNS